jgi:hypothetical protein
MRHETDSLYPIYQYTTARPEKQGPPEAGGQKKAFGIRLHHPLSEQTSKADGIDRVGEQR